MNDIKDLLQVVSQWSLCDRNAMVFSILIYLVIFGLILPEYRIRNGGNVWPVGTGEAFYTILACISHSVLFLLNATLSYALLKKTSFLKYSWICQPFTDNIKEETRIANMIWLYLIVKYLEWTDTILLVRQMGGMGQGWYIHILHHAGMVLIAWLALSNYPSGTTAILVLANSATHAFDYGMLCFRKAGLEVDAKRIQVNRVRKVQFAFVCLASFTAAIVGCGVPRLLLCAVGSFSLFLLVACIQFTGRYW